MIVIGVDEAGRGAWAGPLVVCALQLNTDIDGLTDSKVISRSRRELLRDLIIRSSKYGYGIIDNDYIDKYGLTKATRSAIQYAISSLGLKYDQIIIDGNYNYLNDDPKAVTEVRADFSRPAVSAASILAKTKRDAIMFQMHDEYPGYGFNTNVGYGTKSHIAGLDSFGLCKIHRKSYKPLNKYQ
jgi:ribonuclease HII